MRNDNKCDKIRFRVLSCLRKTHLIIVLILGLNGCSRPQLMPTPNLYIDAPENPFAAVDTSFQTNYVDVLYVTNRRSIVDKHENISYTSERSKSAAYGTCRVEFGKKVSWDRLTQASRNRKRSVSLPLRLTEVDERGRTLEIPLRVIQVDNRITNDPEDKKKQLAVTKQFQDMVRQRLAQTSDKEVYLFIHGFNNAVADAAFVIAELWHFTGRQGMPIIFSWPADHGGLRGYFVDSASGDFSVYHLKRFLEALADVPELERIHVIAHSRGTDVILTALRELYLPIKACGGDPHEELKIGNLILAAADLDLEVVQQTVGVEHLLNVPDRTTVYLSQHDKALGLSGWLFDSAERVGRISLDLLTLKQRKNIEATRTLNLVDARVKTSFIGHGYFHSNPAVSSDLILILRDDLDPGPGNGRPLHRLAPNFWQITDKYLIRGQD